MASATFTNRARIVLVVALTLAAAPLVARAQPSADEKQAQALQVEGLRLMQKGDERHALEKFEAAYRLVASPRILFNRGKAHRALGQDVEALVDLERFLDEAPFAPKESRDEAARVIAELRPRLAYLEIEADEGVELAVDGRASGTAPLARPVVVARGTHEIRGRRAGMNDDVRSVSVIPGQKLRVTVRLTAIEKAAAPPPAPPPAAPATASGAPPVLAAPAPAAPVPVNVAVTLTQPAPPPPTERPWQVTAGWAAAGAGVLFLAGGVTAQVLSSSKGASFNAVKDAPNPTGMCNQMLPNDGGGPCQGLADAARQRQSIAFVGYAASGVALAGSLVLFLASPSQPAARRDVAAACSPATAGVSCALELRF
jgi:hypothetical protein